MRLQYNMMGIYLDFTCYRCALEKIYLPLEIGFNLSYPIIKSLKQRCIVWIANNVNNLPLTCTWINVTYYVISFKIIVI